MLPRRKTVNESVTPLYHVISKCVRSLFLCGGEARKQWLEDRARFLASVFAIDVVGLAFMSNHFHLIVRLNSKVVDSWTDYEVVLRWSRLYPPRDKDRKLIGDFSMGSEYVQERLNDPAWLKGRRDDLANLGWFMKALKEPFAHWVNEKMDETGPVFEPRYKSVAILDEEALIATSVYLDLNPLAAGAVDVPEAAPHTGMHVRLENLKLQGAQQDLIDANQEDRTFEGTQAGQAAAARTTEADRKCWILPVRDERGPDGTGRAGLSDRLDLPTYFRMVDAMSRRIREGKASMDPNAPSIFDRLKLNEEWLSSTVERLKELELTGKWGRARGFIENLKKAAKVFETEWLVCPTGRRKASAAVGKGKATVAA